MPTKHLLFSTLLASTALPLLLLSCPTPRALSYHALCASRKDLPTCLGGHETHAKELLASSPSDWPLQTLEIIIPDNILSAQLFFVDQVGNEVDYGAYTTTFSLPTYSCHSWRVYVQNSLSIEIIPRHTLQVSDAVKTYVEQVFGPERAHGAFAFYKTTSFVVTSPCVDNESVVKSASRDSSTANEYNLNYSSLSSENAAMLASSAIMSTKFQPLGRTGVFLPPTPFVPSVSTPNNLAVATVSCNKNLNMWTPLATHAAAILLAEKSVLSHDNWMPEDMDALLGDAIKFVVPENRLDLHV